MEKTRHCVEHHHGSRYNRRRRIIPSRPHHRIHDAECKDEQARVSRDREHHNSASQSRVAAIHHGVRHSQSRPDCADGARERGVVEERREPHEHEERSHLLDLSMRMLRARRA